MLWRHGVSENNPMSAAILLKIGSSTFSEDESPNLLFDVWNDNNLSNYLSRDKLLGLWNFRYIYSFYETHGTNLQWDDCDCDETFRYETSLDEPAVGRNHRFPRIQSLEINETLWTLRRKTSNTTKTITRTRLNSIIIDFPKILKFCESASFSN